MAGDEETTKAASSKEVAGDGLRYKLPTLGDNNWNAWKTRIKVHLKANGLLDCIESSSTARIPPSESKMDSAYLVLLMSVEDHILPIVEAAGNAKEAWKSLEAMFQPRTNVRIANLKRELALLKIKRSESILAYISRAKSLMNELKAIGESINPKDVVLAVLRGLPVEYETVVLFLEAKEGDISLESIVGPLQAVEERKKLVGDVEAKVARTFGHRGQRSSENKGGHNSNGDWKKNKTCFVCGEKGHISHECPDRKDKKSEKSEKKETALSTRVFERPREVPAL
jgi:hypothetical protein